MKGSRINQPPRAWVLLGWVLLCAPLLAQAQSLSGLRVLPHADSDHSFSGWQSEGAVPPSLPVPLELGDEVYGATLQLQPATAGETYRVRVQYETSLGLSAEGPHLDLTDWKHCVSDWEDAEAIDAVSFVLPTPSPEQHACFPKYTPAELEQAVHAHARKLGDPSQARSWLDGLRHTSSGQMSPEMSGVSPFVAISAVRVKVEVLREGKWVEATTVVFLPPMGC